MFPGLLKVFEIVALTNCRFHRKNRSKKYFYIWFKTSKEKGGRHQRINRG